MLISHNTLYRCSFHFLTWVLNSVEATLLFNILKSIHCPLNVENLNWFSEIICPFSPSSHVAFHEPSLLKYFWHFIHVLNFVRCFLHSGTCQLADNQ
jgi:hypothetical protein